MTYAQSLLILATLALSACSSTKGYHEPMSMTENKCTGYWSPWSQLCSTSQDQAEQMYLLDMEIADDWRKRVFFCANGAHKSVCWKDGMR